MQCFWKMGVAGIKQLPRTFKIASFSGNLNGEALLKVSFKNIDWFQKYKFSKNTAFSKNALKIGQILENSNFFLHFLLQFYRAFQWYIIYFHTLRGLGCTDQNINQEIRGCVSFFLPL